MAGRDFSNVFDAMVIQILEDPEFAQNMIEPEEAEDRSDALDTFLDEMEPGQQFSDSERKQILAYVIEVTYGLDKKKMKKLQEELDGEMSAEFAL